jgi:cell division protein FtsZ
VSPDLHPAEAFVAPRARAAGTPSPEALARLQAAVSKSPGARPANPTAAAASQQPAAEARPRFGLGSLINRMSGHPEAERAAPVPAPRQQPRVTPHYDDEAEMTPEQERIEIPAFLRRQAN